MEKTIPSNRTETLFAQSIRRFAGRFTPGLIDSAIEMIQFNGLEQSLESVRKIYRPGSSLLKFTSTHRSHGEVAAVVYTAREVHKSIPGVGTIYLLIAASLDRGQQGIYADAFFHQGAKPVLNAHGIQTLPVATDNDVNKRGIRPKPSDARAFKAAIAEPDSAFFVFPEGSVQGGRHRRTFGLPIGNIHGSIPFNGKGLPSLLADVEKRGRELIIVPVGTSGTNKIISADYLNPTVRGLTALLMQRAGMRIKLATVTYGEPFILRTEDFMSGAGVNYDIINSMVASRVNHLIPQNERGVYSNTV